MKRMHFPSRREKRHLEAVERDTAHSARPVAEQLELMASRPGSSARETERLMGQPRRRRRKKVA